MKHLEVAREGEILIITINTPPDNIITREVFLEFDVCRDIMLSSEIESIIFSGKGNTFSKGVSLEEIRSIPNVVELRQGIIYTNEFYRFVYNLEKPVIAAINGHCLGGGLELALVCHFRFCAEKARLGLPEISNDIIPCLGGIQHLIHVLGEAKALELILLGDIISASEALRLNLVNRIFPQNDFMTYVLSFTRAVLMSRRECIREVLRLMKMTRSDKEEKNINASIESFMHLRFGN